MSNRKSNTAKTTQATKLYLVPQVDKETGEETFVPKYKYIPGSPITQFSRVGGPISTHCVENI